MNYELGREKGDKKRAQSDAIHVVLGPRYVFFFFVFYILTDDWHLDDNYIVGGYSRDVTTGGVWTLFWSGKPFINVVYLSTPTLTWCVTLFVFPCIIFRSKLYTAITDHLMSDAPLDSWDKYLFFEILRRLVVLFRRSFIWDQVSYIIFLIIVTCTNNKQLFSVL